MFQNGTNNVSIKHTLNTHLSNNAAHRKSSLLKLSGRKYSDFIKLGKDFTCKDITDKKSGIHKITRMGLKGSQGSDAIKVVRKIRI